MAYRIEMLGGLRLLMGERTITRFRSQKTALLLAYLSCRAGRPTGREELIERFWPEDDLDDGRNSLRVALASLRRLLEAMPTPSGSVLVATRSHVYLNAEAIETDVTDFERAIGCGNVAVARALYAGGFLSGFYDDWSLSEQERLQALFDSLPSAVASVMVESPPSPSSPQLPVRAIPTVRGWLPLVLTQFFGREIELATLLSRLAAPTTRLLTLTGPGGTGKTRLAIEAGRTLAEGKAPPRLGAGVWFVPLSAVAESAQIAFAIAAILGVTERPERTLMSALREALGQQRSLLILDNLEQLPPESLAEQLIVLLSELPEVTLLCTSRRRIGIPGEVVVPLAPLPVSDDDSMNAVASSPAVALFAARAFEADVDFALTERNKSGVLALCRTLEGLPLALEMAASWMGVTTPQTFLEELAEHPAELTGRGWGVEPRHRSLQATLAWSLDRLPADVTRVFLGLCVFPGSFTLASAAAVVDASAATMATLVEHSLVQAQPNSEPRRFQLLETLRAGGRERLDSDTLLALQHRLSTYVAALLENGRFDARCIDDGYAALSFYEAHDREAALRLACGLTEYWWPAGLWRKGLILWERLLTESDIASVPLDLLALCYQRWGKLAFYATDSTLAASCFQQAKTLWQQTGNAARAASMAANLACVAHEQGDSAGAEQALLEALPALVGTEYERTSLSNLVEIQLALGATQEASLTMQRVATQYADGHAWVLDLNARIAFASSDYDRAQRHAQSALIAYRANNEIMRCADILLLLARIAYQSGAVEECLATLAESIQARRTFADDAGAATHEFLQTLGEAEIALPTELQSLPRS